MKTSPMPRFVTIVCALSLSLQSVSAVEYIAHRGSSIDAPENTVAAAKLAFQQGSDGVECDIYLTKDGHAAVIHDSNTKRTTGVNGKVGEMTLAEIQALDASTYFKGKKYAGEKVPSLEDILALVPEGRRLIVELKGGEELIPAIRKALAGANKKTDQIQFIGFNIKTIAAVKQAFPEHRALWLLNYRKDKTTRKEDLTLEDAIRKCKETKLDGLDLSQSWPIDQAFVKKVKDAGLLLYVYTVNDTNKANELLKAGVDAITTDRPLTLRAAAK